MAKTEKQQEEVKQMIPAGAIELEIVEVLQLNSELLLLQKEKELSFTLKYDLVKLYEKTKTIRRHYEQQRVDIIKEYGKCINEKKDEWTLDGSDKEAEGMKILSELNEKKEHLVASFKKEDFEELKSDQIYVQIMRFIN